MISDADPNLWSVAPLCVLHILLGYHRWCRYSPFTQITCSSVFQANLKAPFPMKHYCLPPSLEHHSSSVDSPTSVLMSELQVSFHLTLSGNDYGQVSYFPGTTRKHLEKLWTSLIFLECPALGYAWMCIYWVKNNKHKYLEIGKFPSSFKLRLFPCKFTWISPDELVC